MVAENGNHLSFNLKSNTMKKSRNKDIQTTLNSQIN